MNGEDVKVLSNKLDNLTNIVTTINTKLEALSASTETKEIRVERRTDRDREIETLRLCQKDHSDRLLKLERIVWLLTIILSILSSIGIPLSVWAIIRLISGSI